MELRRSEFELETIVSRIHRGELDLQPDFQRGEIWDKKRRQRLIDSLLRGWYVPAIHIVSAPDSQYDTVLDGQQRLAAIRDFFSDNFSVDGKITPASEEIRSLDGKRFSELPQSTQRKLLRFTLPCVTLYDFEPDEPNELFFRLNQSYNLTPPEKRNALHGKARGQVRELVGSLGSLGLLSPGAVGFSNGRLAYDDIVARTCLAVERRNLRQHINNNVVEDFYRTREFSVETLTTVYGAGRDLFRMTERLTERVRFNKATLFSWLIFCSWVPGVTGSSVPDHMLDTFEGHRRTLKKNLTHSSLPPGMAGAIRLYDDRASYRVTDVSSVLIRDCVLYLFLSEFSVAPPLRGSGGLRRAISEASESTAQNSILGFITSDSSDWGTDLPLDGQGE
ncbi:DUF262 domain-containing protein [Amycolatopsis sp. NPDC005232]|uniref:DUF262 domain-containing protein n=1 Tax=Amycolatopsis sp. NPDC005232 TaxID=3157027 RepID=UPI00339DC695